MPIELNFSYQNALPEWQPPQQPEPNTNNKQNNQKHNKNQHNTIPTHNHNKKIGLGTKP